MKLNEKREIVNYKFHHNILFFLKCHCHNYNMGIYSMGNNNLFI